MESVNIIYRIKLSDQQTEVFDYEMDAETFEIISTPKSDKLPAWTELGFKQCANCPLNVAEHPHCPVAVQLHYIVDRFHKTRSIDEVDLEVVTEQRTVSTRTALQNAISSMLGLVFPISGCPNTEGMKPLARFHVPMATEEETVFNVAGMYLLAQYFVNLKNKNGVLSFDGLIKMYDDLHVVNKTVASRLQAVTSSDSVKNAITLLDMYSSLIPMLLQDQLVEIRKFFTAYLPEGEVIAPTSNYLEQAKAFKLELIPTDEELQAKAAAEAAAAKAAEEEASKGLLPEWLRKALPGDSPSRPKVEPAPSGTGGSVVDAVNQAEPVKEQPKPVYSDFVLSLSLEPMDEVKPDEGGKAT